MSAGVFAHHRPDVPLPAPSPAWESNFDGIGYAIDQAATEVVHVVQPFLPFLLPFVVAYLLLWWAFDYLMSGVSKQQGLADDYAEENIAFAQRNGRAWGAQQW